MRDGLLGWTLPSLLHLDDQCHGVLARVLSAAPGRRQAIFAALAVRDIEGEIAYANEDLLPPPFAEIVRHGRSAEILRHAFGEVPQGFPGLLERVGEWPLPRPQSYIALRDLVASGEPRSICALRDSGRITLRKLDILSSLDPRWRHANTLSRLDTPAEAVRFNAAIEFVQGVCSKADDEAIALAIANMSGTGSLPRLLHRFIRRADRLPANPVPAGDVELRPFTSMREYLDAARRYRNCLASKLDQVAAGRFAIAEFKDQALLEFRSLTAGAGWMLWLVHGPRNGPTPLKVYEEAEAKCDRLGIPRQDDNAGGSLWRSYRHFSQALDWD
ncbi:hypothetical protein [Brevundimonas diminuta]|uniref:hypothetical protein n=1 Tax=Brevundimonas diminuta TaxID=293 RepID=UPI000590DAB2|nr:hypothetical protein [Brevundimonas diminuta]WQE44944.1 hypothetical protein U0020_15355 [Brevundimonas diminuta]SUW17463.1 Uncharacterised protein [Brevundimonas diminuta]